MYKFLLFDFDGTLIDTNELIILALNETSRKFLNRDLSKQELNSILGKYLDEQMRTLSKVHYKEMVLFYKSIYKEKEFEMIKEFCGIGSMLLKLKELGCKIAIVSAKGRSGIENGLKHFRLSDFIDTIISAYDVKENKPNPECVFTALESLSGSLKDSLVIGDSPYDILCGKNAGVKTCLVDWTIFPKQEILNLNPDFYIKTPEDLVEIVKAS